MSKKPPITISESDNHWTSSKASYTHTLDGGEHKERLRKLESDISILHEEQRKLLRHIADDNKPADGWKIDHLSAAAYGNVTVTYSRDVQIDRSKDATKGALELALQKVDAKTLFHSNVLTREEKRALLGLAPEDAK